MQSRTLATYLLTAALGFASAGESIAQTEFRVMAHSAGPIELGMSVDQLYAVVGRESVRLFDQFSEGMFEPALAIDLPGSEVSPAAIASYSTLPCRRHAITSVMIFDPRFKTDKGVGIGSTVADLRRHYEVELSGGEGFNAVVEAESITFKLNGVSESSDVISLFLWASAASLIEECGR